MRDTPDTNAARYIPKTRRLDVPLRSVVNLRRVAGELRALAQELDVISRFRGDANKALFDAACACDRTRNRLNEIKAPGRPKKGNAALYRESYM